MCGGASAAVPMTEHCESFLEWFWRVSDHRCLMAKLGFCPSYSRCRTYGTKRGAATYDICFFSVCPLEPTQFDLGEVWVLPSPFLAPAHHGILFFNLELQYF